MLERLPLLKIQDAWIERSHIAFLIQAFVGIFSGKAVTITDLIGEFPVTLPDLKNKNDPETKDEIEEWRELAIAKGLKYSTEGGETDGYNQ